jgi:hypothetical protein
MDWTANGVLDAAKAAHRGKMFSLFVHPPGEQEYRSMRRSAFQPDFQSMVDSVDGRRIRRVWYIDRRIVNR